MDDVALFLFQCGANILDSRVSLLRGQFALLLLVAGDDAAFAKIDTGLPELNQSASIQAAMRPANAAPHSDDTHFKLTASGRDQAGVVHKISHLMRALSVNIDNVQTHVDDTNGGAFELQMDLAVPRQTPIVMMKQYVDSLANEIGIRCDISPM